MKMSGLDNKDKHSIEDYFDKYTKEVNQEMVEHPLRPHARKQSDEEKLAIIKDKIDNRCARGKKDDIQNADILYIPPLLLKHESTVEAISFDKYNEKLLGLPATSGDQPSGPLNSRKIKLFLNQQQLDISAYVSWCAKHGDNELCRQTNIVHKQFVSQSQFRHYAHKPDNERYTIISNGVVDERTMTFEDGMETKEQKIKSSQLYHKNTIKTNALFPILPGNIVVTDWDECEVNNTYVQPQPLSLDKHLIQHANSYVMFPMLFQFVEEEKMCNVPPFFNLMLCGVQTPNDGVVYLGKQIWSISPQFIPSIQPLVYHDVAASMTLQKVILESLASINMGKVCVKKERGRTDKKYKVEHKGEHATDDKMPIRMQLLQTKVLKKMSNYTDDMDKKQRDVCIDECAAKLNKYVKTVWWTLDAFLCSVDSKIEFCTAPLRIEVIPVKESLRDNDWMTWFEYDKGLQEKQCDRRVTYLRWACTWIHTAKSLCKIHNIEPFMHGSFVKENCGVYGGQNIKVGNFSRTYLSNCHPLLSKHLSWTNNGEYFNSFFGKTNYNESMADFTYYYTYILNDNDNDKVFVKQNRDSKWKRQHFSTLVEWFDIFTMINSLKQGMSTSSFLDALLQWPGFKDSVIQSMLTHTEHDVKDFMRDRFSSYSNKALPILSKEEYNIPAFIAYLEKIA